MSVHLQADLQTLHRDLLSMSASVEDMIHRAVALLSEPDLHQARELAAQDTQIDRWDVAIEENCLKILALHQPVAIDLRRLTTVLKIIGELERVADLAVNIAERACGLLDEAQVTVPDELKDMAQRAVDMLHRSIDAYVALDGDMARRVVAEDDEIDRANEMLINDLINRMHQQHDRIDAFLHLFSAVRHVERVGDHATNIAEDVVYLVEGQIIRHAGKLDRDETSSP
ncbi:MAG: phosphate transport system regulatory protein PhoU [Planctomycetota bacterium]|nr:MAG: phosphate transport system regulatory protein PhoU [Planctomycetota bacterium]REJ94285.1 MAG: phosphate transport system regulatory protein PhoU [Planctomycetota bacterium]REK26424.1 MAG: phosphate transport system regulatory protein PhoU [Planctomycetota bacterium]REK32057.1 MAG: phosphate transport system regulatory protein PhoU [Planctomycetota bacterium]